MLPSLIRRLTMNNATTTHQSTLVVEKKARLLPEFIGH